MDIYYTNLTIRKKKDIKPYEKRSILIHNASLKSYGVPEEIRTPDTRLRRAMLYPAELLRRLVQKNKIII